MIAPLSHRDRPSAGIVDLHHLDFAAAAPLAPAARTLLTAGERDRADRFRAPSDAERFVLSHAFLRMTLAAYLDCAPRDVPIAIEPMGKPVLADRHGLAFSLAHGERHALVAVARELVGVDVETPRPRIDTCGIARRFFSATEAQLVERGGEAAFRRLWVCKEAFMKAIGLGLACPLDACVIDGLAGDVPRLAVVPIEGGVPSDWSLAFWNAADDSGAIGAVAVRAQGAILRAFDGLDWFSAAFRGDRRAPVERGMTMPALAR